MRELVTAAEKRGHVEEVLNNPKHPHWMRAMEWATERGYGKTPQQVAVTGEDGGPVEVVHRVIKWGNEEIPL